MPAVRRRRSNFIDLRDFAGIDLTGASNSDTAFATAIAQAKTAGISPTGGTLFHPGGNILLTSPVSWPRTGSSPTGVVNLVGSGNGSCTITGSGSNFVDRGVIEWEATTSPVWNQRFENLRIVLPNVAGAMGFYHKANQALISASTCISEWMTRCIFRNLQLWGNTDYHYNGLMYFDVAARFSKFDHITGNITLGAAQTYAVKLFRSRYQLRTGVSAGVDTGTSNPVEGADTVGFAFCSFTDCDSVTQSSGWNTLFDARMLECRVARCFSNGGRSGQGAVDFYLRNTTDTKFMNVGTEGNASTSLKLDNCVHNTFDNFTFPASRPSDAAWVTGHAYSIGDRVVSTAMKNASPQATANLYFTCTTAGTSGGTEPTWGTVGGGTTADNGVVWTASSTVAVGNCIDGVSAVGNRFTGRRDPPGGNPASYRRAYAVNFDSACTDNVGENFSVRGVVTGSTVDGSADAANEFSIGSIDNRNHFSGHLTQSFNNYRLPYSAGSHPHRPSRTAALDFGSISAASAATLTITVSGAIVGDDVRLTPPSNLNAGLIPTGWVSADNTVTVRLYNATASPIDPASGTWRATVLKP